MSDNLYKNYVKEERNSQKNIWTPYDNNESENSASEEDHHEDSPKGKSKKKYSVISQAVREKFIKRVLSKEVTIKEAAKEFGLKFSTSKAILQTYKKEGRIGKKKNRERKTKVVNAVFIANINPNNSLLGSLPLGPLNELKNLNLPNVNDPNIAKGFDQNLGKLSDQKFAKGASINGYNKVTQSIIKEFGNDFLRDFIEKNFSQSRPQTLNPTPEASSSLPVNTNFGSTNLTGMKHFINFSTSNTNKPNTSAFNSVSGLGNTSVLMPQKVSSINSDVQPMGGLNIPSTNQSKFLNANKADSFLSNQKRAFQQYERESIGDFGTRSDQINDISVKKFKSGEDLWDFDVDKSKKDLEDFIYKTHNIIKNNLNDL